MIIILGNPGDILINEINKQLCSEVFPVSYLSEEVLFTSVPFAYEQNGKNIHRFLRINECKIHFSDLSGVLVRFPRTWWPSSEFDLQDQTFIFHEETAAWFYILSELNCPVINRFALGWWLQDLTYPIELRKCLAMQLDIDTINYVPSAISTGYFFPSQPDNSPDSIGVYLVGERLIPRSSLCNKVIDQLRQNLRVLERWQNDNGLIFCRLDFKYKEKLILKHVEVFPLLSDEPIELVDEISKELIELLI